MDKSPKPTFTKGRHRKCQNITRKCSTSLIIMEMQIKTAMRYHFTPTGVAITKKMKDGKCWQGCGVKRTLYTVGGSGN